MIYAYAYIYVCKLYLFSVWSPFSKRQTRSRQPPSTGCCRSALSGAKGYTCVCRLLGQLPVHERTVATRTIALLAEVLVIVAAFAIPIPADGVEVPIARLPTMLALNPHIRRLPSIRTIACRKGGGEQWGSSAPPKGREGGETIERSNACWRTSVRMPSFALQ